LKAKLFSDCDILGPGVIILMGRGDVKHCSMMGCNFVVFNPNKPHSLYGAAGFESTVFERCRFVNITFVIPPKEAIVFRKNPGGQHITFIGFEFEEEAISSIFQTQ
jgi:hypothetical protein